MVIIIDNQIAIWLYLARTISVVSVCVIIYGSVLQRYLYSQTWPSAKCLYHHHLFSVKYLKEEINEWLDRA